AGPLSTAPLQHPRLLQALLACIFTPSRPPSPDLMAACVELLARATCVRPRPPPLHPGTTAAAAPSPDAAGGSGSGSGGGASQQQQQHSPQHPQQQGGGEEEAEAEAEAAAARIAETRAALQWAVGLLGRPQGRFTEEDARMAAEVSRLPVVAHGLLHAVGCQLGSPAFYEDGPAAVAAVPSLLRISLAVAAGGGQPQTFIPRVLSAWSVALTELHRGGQGEVCRLLLDACVVL
ncbi:hypothetical protein Agub_g1590, partial [Astrephomene gubernaculifera]